MPRKLRVEYPGAMYHVMSRGDRREDIFLDDVDRQDFIKTLAEASQKTGCRKEMLQRMRHLLGEHHAGELHRECTEAKVQQILTEELSQLGWSDANLRARPKSHPAKLAIVVRLRRETTLSIKAIASRVHLGTSKSANNRLHAAMIGHGSAPSNQSELGP